MTTVLLDSDNLSATEVALSLAFSTKVCLRAITTDGSRRTRLLRSTAGPLIIDHAYFTSDFVYEMAAPRKIQLCRFRAGGIGCRSPDHDEPEWFGPGDVAAFGALAGIALEGEIHCAQYDILHMDRDTLADDGAVAPRGCTREPMRFTGDAPIGPEANRHIACAIDYVCNTVARDPFAAQDPRIGGVLQRYLAATMLATFPHTAQPDSNITDDPNTTLELLQVAIKFIDDNAQRDISTADIAGHVHLSPRAIQLMFRKHRGCTPMEYLRTIRLQHARIDLLTGDRHTTTVTEIAQRWRFGHVGRFAVLYRQRYGQSPHETLRGQD